MIKKYRAWQDGMTWPWRLGLAVFGLLLIPLLAFLGNELVNRGDFAGIQEFLTARGGVFLLAYIIYFTVLLFLYVLLGRAKLAVTIYSLLFLVLGIVNYFKVEFRGEPLMLRDIFSAGAAMDILDYFELNIPFSLIMSLVFFAAQVCIGFLMPRKTKLCIHKRLIAVVALSIFAVEGTQVLWKNEKSNVFGAYYVHWSPQQNYSFNGMALSLLFTGQSFVVHEPRFYTAEDTKEALLTEEAYEPLEISAEKQPHIIAIMGEAYADLRMMNDGLEFLDDPFEPITSAPGNLKGGQLEVSIIGGSTAVSEFEFLTGYTQRLFPTGTVAYQHYFSDFQPSIVSTLKNVGYDTIALHPNVENYWARDVAYSSMGFERFIDIKGFTTPRYRNGFITDEVLGTVMMQKFRDRNPDQPLFMFAVTIENHSPYNKADNGDAPYAFDASGIENLSEDGRLGINNHTTGVKHTSELVRALIDYFTEQEEPVLLVVFGDHQPRVDIPQSVVRASDANSDEEELLKNEHSTVYYVWANYDVDLAEIPDIISPNFLSTYVLRAAGVDLPRYLRKAYEVSKTVPALTNSFSVNTEGVVRISGSENKAEWEAINDILLLQYDWLFGSKYNGERMWNIPKEE